MPKTSQTTNEKGKEMDDNNQAVIEELLAPVKEPRIEEVRSVPLSALDPYPSHPF